MNRKSRLIAALFVGMLLTRVNIFGIIYTGSRKGGAGDGDSHHSCRNVRRAVNVDMDANAINQCVARLGKRKEPA